MYEKMWCKFDRIEVNITNYGVEVVFYQNDKLVARSMGAPIRPPHTVSIQRVRGFVEVNVKGDAPGPKKAS